ncbi:MULTISPECIES: SCO4225 family membrane protein [unclassified Streptomyces]|uniref:SCO4225 family membrane protein n=1 Tax=unclassified Streptomyces TaxID=2593676 RepID=UPI00379DEC57
MDGSPRSLTAKVRHYLLNPAALGYLAMVVGVLAYVEVDAHFVEHQDASFAGLLLFVVTAPTSWLFLMLPEPLPATGIVVGALFQAAVLGVAYRKLSGRPRHRTRPSGA